MLDINETTGRYRSRFRGQTLASAARTRYGRRARVIGTTNLGGVTEVTIGHWVPKCHAYAVDAVWVVSGTTEIKILCTEQQQPATPWSHTEIVDSLDQTTETTPEDLADLLDCWLRDFEVAAFFAGPDYEGRPYRAVYEARWGKVRSPERTWVNGVEETQ